MKAPEHTWGMPGRHFTPGQGNPSLGWGKEILGDSLGWSYYGKELFTGCPVTDRGTLSLIENLQFWPKKSP